MSIKYNLEYKLNDWLYFVSMYSAKSALNIQLEHETQT